MNVRRSGLIIGLLIGGILSTIFGLGFVAGAVFDRHEVSSQVDLSNPDVQNFLDAYHLVTQRSYYRPLNQHQLMYAAINGMLAATGDPHTIFLSPPQNKSANQELNGANYSGIGSIVISSNGLLKVLAALPHEPAADAGLRSNDIITAIDGKSVRGLSGSDAIGRIHGTAGSVVRLTVRRHGGSPFVINVKRQQIPPITAYGRMMGKHMGYIQIFSFGSGTAGQVSDALRQLQTEHARGIILDLRANPGGYVDAAQQIVSRFISHGVVAYERDSKDHLTALPVLTNQRLTNVPVAVLMDRETASAAEITAAALHDEDGAVLVGTRSYGKGSMQSVFTLEDGATVRITDRLWLTPRKRSVSGKGLQPDIRISTSGTPTAGDQALSAATHYLLIHGSR